ncbi:hypothetical protein EVAR_37068_1 [Eumeta japonica]|uniref:Uncharacterized protein n=1 Tax=Eumeta variegata TaxID=151549 RepID=A0A4C1WFX5_EUMVA|nr:hypothetical protein EVAR_37068_1 [Eumeta japonica]
MKFVTKAWQWRKIGTRGTGKMGRVAPNLRIASFAGNSKRQSFVCCTRTGKPHRLIVAARACGRKSFDSLLVKLAIDYYAHYSSLAFSLMLRPRRHSISLLIPINQVVLIIYYCITPDFDLAHVLRSSTSPTLNSGSGPWLAYGPAPRSAFI